MLMPKRAKYRKVQRGRMTGTASRGNKVVPFAKYTGTSNEAERVEK